MAFVYRVLPSYLIYFPFCFIFLLFLFVCVLAQLRPASCPCNLERAARSKRNCFRFFLGELVCHDLWSYRASVHPRSRWCTFGSKLALGSATISIAVSLHTFKCSCSRHHVPQQFQGQHPPEFSCLAKDHCEALNSLDGLFKVVLNIIIAIIKTDSIIRLADYRTYPLLWLMAKQESAVSFPCLRAPASLPHSLRISRHLV